MTRVDAMGRQGPITAVYPGTFDPITNGHLDIVNRALPLFDKLVIAIAQNVRKVPMFPTEERVAMIRAAVGSHPNVVVDSFSGLLVDYVRAQNARVVVRGLRAIADFEYEFQFAHMNRHLAPELETIFLMTGEENFFVSSSLVKEVASMGADITKLAPPAVVAAIKAKLKNGTLP